MHPLDIVVLLEEPRRIKLSIMLMYHASSGTIVLVRLDGHCHALRCPNITVSYHTMVAVSHHGRPLARSINILVRVE